MPEAIALPKATTRSRRRRLPRPPKFSRGDKMTLAWDSALGALNLTAFLAVGHFYNLTAAAGFVADIHAIFLGALRGPLAGLRSGLAAMALWVTSLILLFGGLA